MIADKWLFVMGLLLVMIVVVMDCRVEEGTKKEELDKGKDYSFDYYLFVQQWPSTLCRYHSKHCSKVMDNVDYFTIHG